MCGKYLFESSPDFNGVASCHGLDKRKELKISGPRLTSSMLEPKPWVTSSMVEQQQDRQEAPVGPDHWGQRARPSLPEMEAVALKSCLCFRPPCQEK